MKNATDKVAFSFAMTTVLALSDIDYLRAIAEPLL
jgi:hypothetical protein